MNFNFGSEIDVRAQLSIILFLYCSLVVAEDGLSVQFTIDQRAESSDRLRSYTSAILMRFDEEVSFDLDDLYVLKIRSRPIDDARLNLVVTLKDIIEGKPYYVGAFPVDIKIGESQTIEFHRERIIYTVNLDTSYGTIPDQMESDE